MNEQEIKQANNYKKQPAGSIYTGIVIKGTEYLFCEQRYFDDAINKYLASGKIYRIAGCNKKTEISGGRKTAGDPYNPHRWG